MVWFVTLKVIGRAEGVILPEPSVTKIFNVGEVADSAPELAVTDTSELNANCGVGSLSLMKTVWAIGEY